MKHMYEINVQYQSLQKLDPEKTLANENSWQRWIRSITCSIKRSVHQNKCMTNNMARQREQSQDKPAWELFNTTWPQKPEASYWNITTLWAKTPVNCTGIRQSTCWTAPAARADTTILKINLANCQGAGAEDMTNALVNCTGSRRRDQGCNHHSGKLHGWQAQRPGDQGWAQLFMGIFSYVHVQHHTKWWFCLVSRFSVFQTHWHSVTFRCW